MYNMYITCVLHVSASHVLHLHSYTCITCLTYNYIIHAILYRSIYNTCIDYTPVKHVYYKYYTHVLQVYELHV